MEIEREMICAIYTKKKKEMLIKVSVETMKEKAAWKTIRANEWLKLKFISKYIGWEDVDWMHLTQGTNH